MLACLLAVLIPAGCRPPAPPLRVAANPWPGYEYLFLAETKGYYLDEGLDVHLVETLSLADTRRAFERRQVDIFAGTTVEVLLSTELSDRHPRVFYACDYSEGTDVILARSPVDSMAKLRGKRIGVEPASVNITLLQAGLRQAGLQMEDVVVVPMAQNAMPAAVGRGEVDAVVSYPPVSVQLLREGMRVVFDSASVPGEIMDVLAADACVLDTRGTAIAAFARAYGRAQRFAAEHPEQAQAIMARRERISVAEFQVARQGIRIMTFDEQAESLAPGHAVERALMRTAEGLHGVRMLDTIPDVSAMIHRQLFRVPPGTTP